MGNNDDIQKRIYNFELPYTISSMYVHFGVDKFKSEGYFEQLPPYLQAEFQRAADAWQPITISERDCNAIDDDVWAKIASEIGLDWENG